MKLIEKTRVGSKVKKRYDKARTPYERVLESSYVSEGKKEQLRKLYEMLNVAELKRQILKLQDKLLGIALLKESIRKQKSSKSIEMMSERKSRW